jgi:hypothetical protein
VQRSARLAPKNAKSIPTWITAENVLKNAGIALKFVIPVLQHELTGMQKRLHPYSLSVNVLSIQ